MEDADDLGQGNDRSMGTSKATDLSAVPRFLFAGKTSASYNAKWSDHTITGATLEMEMLSQWGDSTVKDFKSSRINHGR